MDGTATAGRKGIAYLRDYYEPPTTADAGETEAADVGVSGVERRALSGSLSGW